MPDMPEAPNRRILDRDSARLTVAEHFGEQLALLRDLANYGSNLVFRAYGSSKKETTDLMICGVLLRQIVSMVDSVEVLLAAGIVNAGYLSARAAFEASIYLEWMLLSDRDHKARCYAVSNYRDQKHWALKVVPGTPENAAFDQVAASFGLDLSAESPNLASQMAARVAEIDAQLTAPELAAIDQEFQRRRRGGRRKSDVQWFEVAAGLTSIRQVAAAVSRTAEYDVFYSKGSDVTHSGKMGDHVQLGNGSAHIKPLRHLEGIRDLVSFTATVALRAYRIVIAEYRPAELDAVAKKYLEDWRGPFTTIKDVHYRRG
jgi:hypothetical protein